MYVTLYLCIKCRFTYAARERRQTRKSLMVACLIINASRVENKTGSENNDFYSVFILESYLLDLDEQLVAFLTVNIRIDVCILYFNEIRYQQKSKITDLITLHIS